MSDSTTFDGSITVRDTEAALAAVNEAGEVSHASLAAAIDAVFSTGEDLEDYGIEVHADQSERPEPTFSFYGCQTVSDDEAKRLLSALAPHAEGQVEFRQDASSSAWRLVIRDGHLFEETGATRYEGDLPVVEATEPAQGYRDLSENNATIQATEDEGVQFSVATFVTVPSEVSARGSDAVERYIVQTLREGSSAVTHRVQTLVTATTGWVGV